MSAYQGKRTFNKYPYSHNQLSADNPFRYMGMGVSYNPYLPKVSNPPEKYESNQSSSPYEKKDRPYNRNSSASLINNSYNIINNNGSYNKNRNFASLRNRKDHVAELFNYQNNEQEKKVNKTPYIKRNNNSLPNLSIQRYNLFYENEPKYKN